MLHSGEFSSCLYPIHAGIFMHGISLNMLYSELCFSAVVGGRLSFFVGVIISSAMANAVQGAVKAVLVCYVDHPAKLHENHPLETRELSAAIALVFPEVPEFSFDTTVV